VEIRGSFQSFPACFMPFAISIFYVLLFVNIFPEVRIIERNVALGVIALFLLDQGESYPYKLSSKPSTDHFKLGLLTYSTKLSVPDIIKMCAQELTNYTELFPYLELILN